jgi:hypothetical protein
VTPNRSLERTHYRALLSSSTLGAFIMHSVQHDRGMPQNASGCLKTCFQPSSS